MNSDITSPDALNETDASWIGRGSEFASQLFKTAVDVQNKVSKYGSVEFITYGLCYALGDISEATGVYTIKPMNPGTSIQLPSFTVVEKLAEGGGTAIDAAYTGCVADSMTISWQYGPGLKSVSSELTYRGSGAVTTPSGVDMPDVTSEHHALTAGMAFSVNGTDYVPSAIGLSGSFRWSNNLLADDGYFVGSGLSNGYAVRKRLEIGNRECSFEFTVRMLNTSDEFTKLKNLTTGPATITFNYDATHLVTLSFPKVGFKRVQNTEVNGIAALTISAEPLEDATDGLLTVTAKCPISGIGQAAA